MARGGVTCATRSSAKIILCQWAEMPCQRAPTILARLVDRTRTSPIVSVILRCATTRAERAETPVTMTMAGECKARARGRWAVGDHASHR